MSKIVTINAKLFRHWDNTMRNIRPAGSDYPDPKERIRNSGTRVGKDMFNLTTIFKIATQLSSHKF